MALQKTVESEASISGVGLHTGCESEVTLKPAEAGEGIHFVRTDLPDSNKIKAVLENVVDIEMGTTIGKDGIKVYTIEHLMSALAGLEIDNCLIEVNGEEVPVMDGSAAPFVEIIKEAGIKELDTEKEYITFDKPMWLFRKDNIALSVFPSDSFHITLLTDYDHEALGAQHTTLFSLKDFDKEFAPARTFCFLSWVEHLREKGLIKGGSPESAVVVQDIPVTEEHIKYIKDLFNIDGEVVEGKNGFLNNTELRFYNELCRHKAVDLIGDLSLLGKPIKGHILAARTGHAANIGLARKIKEYVEAKEKEANLGHSDILDILPHRYPFLFVDGVEYIDPGKYIKAVKNVSFNDPFFQGHFPGNPIMPGVLQIEAMAQASGVMALFGKEKGNDKAMLFMGIDKARFRGVVRPGDNLVIEVETLQYRRGTLKCKGRCFVRDKLVCEAELMCMLG